MLRRCNLEPVGFTAVRVRACEGPQRRSRDSSVGVSSVLMHVCMSDRLREPFTTPTSCCSLSPPPLPPLFFSSSFCPSHITRWSLDASRFVSCFPVFPSLLCRFFFSTKRDTSKPIVSFVPQNGGLEPFSNRRHALIQVCGEKVVLRHYVDLAETALACLTAVDTAELASRCGYKRMTLCLPACLPAFFATFFC